MSLRTRATVAISSAALLALSACGAAPERPASVPVPTSANYTLVTETGLPVLGIAPRDGDPAVGIAFSVATETDEAAVLAALVKVRLTAKFGGDLTVQPGEAGYRVRGRVSSPAALTDLMDALRTKVTDREVPLIAQEAARYYAGASASSPLSICQGRLSKPRGALPTTASALEAVRSRNHVSNRVAFGAVVPRAEVAAWSNTWRALSPLPVGDPVTFSLPISDGVNLGFGRELSMDLVLTTRQRARAIATAETIVEKKTALRAHLEANRLRLTEVQTTLFPRGGACLVVRAQATPEFASRLTVANLSAAPGLYADELANLAEYTQLAPSPRLRGGDASETAEELSWWLVTRDAPKDTPEAHRVDVTAPESRDKEAAPVVVVRPEGATPDVRLKTESGHSEVHVLVGSPCGTYGEGSYDTGLAAWAAEAATFEAQRLGLGGTTSVVRGGGVGIYVHAAPNPGETPQELAYRATSLALRSWYLPDQLATTDARRALLGRSSDLLARLAQLRAPTHPSWVAPWGTEEALRGLPESVLAQMDAGPRGGPLRVAIIAETESQKVAATKAAALWKPRAGAKCDAPQQESVRPLKPPMSAGEVLLLGLPVAGDRHVAEVWAQVLEDPAGSLAKGLEPLGVRLAVSATGRDDARLLVFKLEGAVGNLARAEEVVRKTLDQLRETPVPDATFAAALKRQGTSVAARLEALFIDATPGSPPPTPAALRSFATQFFKPDAALKAP